MISREETKKLLIKFYEEVTLLSHLTYEGIEFENKVDGIILLKLSGLVDGLRDQTIKWLNEVYKFNKDFKDLEEWNKYYLPLLEQSYKKKNNILKENKDA